MSHQDSTALPLQDVLQTEETPARAGDETSQVSFCDDLSVIHGPALPHAHAHDTVDAVPDQQEDDSSTSQLPTLDVQLFTLDVQLSTFDAPAPSADLLVLPSQDETQAGTADDTTHVGFGDGDGSQADLFSGVGVDDLLWLSSDDFSGPSDSHSYDLTASDQSVPGSVDEAPSSSTLGSTLVVPPRPTVQTPREVLEQELRRGEESMDEPMPQLDVAAVQDDRTLTEQPPFQSMLVVGPVQLPQPPGPPQPDGTYTCETQVRTRLADGTCLDVHGQPIDIPSGSRVYEAPDVVAMQVPRLEEQTFRRFISTVPDQHRSRVRRLRRAVGNRHSGQSRAQRQAAANCLIERQQDVIAMYRRRLRALISAVRAHVAA
jgi:hypothetical protein